MTGVARVAAAALAGAVAAVAPVGSARTAHTAPAAATILIAGDSLAQGYGSPDGAGIRTELAARLAQAGITATFTAGGAYGAAIQDVTRALPGQLTTAHPDVVVLLAGTNNAAGGCGQPPPCAGMTGFDAAYGQALNTILTSDPNITAVAVEVPYSVAPWSPNQVTVNAAIIRLAWTNPRILRVDASGLPRCLLLDGVHPGEEGYRILGRLIYSAFQRLYGLPQLPGADPVRASPRRPGYEIAPTDSAC